MNSKLNKILTATVAAATILGTLGMASEAKAVSFTYGTDEEVTSINRLPIGAYVFRVDFQTGTYNDIYTSQVPYFLNNSAGAQDAADAILIALEDNKFTVNNGGLPVDPGQVTDAFFIPYSINTTQVTGFLDQNSTSLLLDSRTTTTANRTATRTYAQFTVVPESGTDKAVLGLAGLGLFGLIRRRRSFN